MINIDKIENALGRLRKIGYISPQSSFGANDFYDGKDDINKKNILGLFWEVKQILKKKKINK